MNHSLESDLRNGTMNSTSELSLANPNSNWFIFLPLLTILSLMGTFANMLVMFTIYRIKSLRKTYNIFVFSLAIADVTMCSIYGLSLVYTVMNTGWYLNPRICVFVATLVLSTGLVSNMLMTFIAINRYCLVVKGISIYKRIFTTNHSMLMLSVAWAWGMLFIIPPFVGFGQLGYDEGLNACLLPNTIESNRYYWMLLLSVGWCLPVTVSSFCYARIYLVVRGSRMKVQQSTTGRDKDRRRKADVKLTKDLFVMYGVFYLCTIPYSVAQVVDQKQVILPGIVHGLMGVAMWSNSVWNPMLLSLRNKEFRAGVYASFSPTMVQEESLSISSPTD